MGAPQRRLECTIFKQIACNCYHYDFSLEIKSSKKGTCKFDLLNELTLKASEIGS